MTDRLPLDDSPIEPRPLFPTLAPEPVAPPVRLPEPRPMSIKGTVEQDGPTRDEILLQAIVLEARRKQTPATKGALRNLIAKFSCECGLGF
jgi:hypothetical protein